MAFAGVLCVAVVGLVLLLAREVESAPARAVLGMGLALALIWIGLGGALQWALQPGLTRAVSAAPGPWPVKFVVVATLLALIEEAITVSLTRSAPLWGVPYGAAYITASGSYLDVVLLHSVVVFVPMFVAWALLLRYVDASPAAVLLLFGLNGTVGESFIGGSQAWLQAPFWIFVYGLMIWLPACSLPAAGSTLRPFAGPLRWWHVPLALLLPILFAIPVALLLSWLHPIPIHFPPLGG